MPFDTLGLACFAGFLAALIVLVNAHRVRAYSARILLRVGGVGVMLGAVAGLIVDSVPPPLIPANVSANVPASLSILATLEGSQPDAPFLIESLRGTDGAVRWQAPLPSGAHLVSYGRSMLVAVSETILHGSELDAIALAAPSGNLQWRTALPGLPDSRITYRALTPVIDGPYVFVAVRGNTIASAGHAQLYALDVTNGRLLWRTAVSDLGGAGIAAEASFFDGSLYYISQDGSIVALHAQDGSPAWRSIPRDYRGDLLAGGGNVFAQFDAHVSAGYSSGVAALSAKDGSRLWTYGGTPDLSLDKVTLSLGDGQLYVAATTPRQGAQLSALAVATGALLWKATAGVNLYRQRAIRSSTVVYFPGDTTLFARRAEDGGLLWQHTGNANAGYETPVVTATALFTVSQVVYPHYFISCPPACEPVPALTAFNAATGSIYWRTATPANTLLTLIGASG